ncbi:MAG: O-antigen ligase family protein [Bacteroidota bacterium]
MKKYSTIKAGWRTAPHFVEQKMQLLLVIWLFLAILAPHQEMYKVFFHIIIIPALIISFFNRNFINNYKDPLLCTALLFFAYAAIATFFTDFGTTQTQIRAIRWTIEASFCLFAFWVWMPDVIKKHEWWSKYLLWITFLSASLAILNFWLLEDFQGRLTGFGGLQHPIQTGSVLIILLAITHFMLVIEKQLDSKPQLILFSATVLSVFVAVFLSESRGPIGAMLLYVAFITAINIWAKSNIKNIILFLSVFVVGCIIAISIHGTEQYIDNLLARGMSYRLGIWYGYFNFPPDTWWLGFGLDSDPHMLPAKNAYWEPNNVVITHPHSIFLGTLFETGIIGIFFLVTMCTMLIHNIIKAPCEVSVKIRLLGILFLISLLGLTSGQGVIYSVKTFWIIIWFPVIYIWMWCKLSAYAKLNGHRYSVRY